MDFSVLISVYYKEKPQYLKQSLNSVFENSVMPTEVVLVKDGLLTPELDQVINEFCDKYDNLKVVELKENQGLGIALKIGTEHCKYEFIARMDTDDICEKDCFKTQLEVFKKNPNASLVGGYITEFVDDPTNIVSMRKVPTGYEQIKKYAKKRNPINHVTAMFRKSDVLEVGGYQKVKEIGYEDYDLWIRLIMANKLIINVENVLVNFRVGKDMYKRRGDKKRLKTALFFRKKLWKIGYYSFFAYIYYSLQTIAFFCVPAFVRKLLYKTILRK